MLDRVRFGGFSKPWVTHKGNRVPERAAYSPLLAVEYCKVFLYGGKMQNHPPQLAQFNYTILVWTPSLMHRCVCIWRYILQNYNYKLHFQNLFTFLGTLAAENFAVYTACDLWDNNIQLTMVKDRRSRPDMPFLDNNTCAGGGLFISIDFITCMMPSMDGWRDGWMEKTSRSRRPLLYVIIVQVWRYSWNARLGLVYIWCMAKKKFFWEFFFLFMVYKFLSFWKNSLNFQKM